MSNTPQVICDLDGTLSKYPGSDFRSLFTKFSEINEKELSEEIASKRSAEIMINRYTAAEIKLVRDNLIYLHNRYGSLLLFSLNYKIVAIKYLQELEVVKLFDFDNSKFREDMSDNPDKDELWLYFTDKYPSIIYIEDDISIIRSLQKVKSENVNFVHMTEWLGLINIKSLLESKQ